MDSIGEATLNYTNQAYFTLEQVELQQSQRCNAREAPPQLNLSAPFPWASF